MRTTLALLVTVLLGGCTVGIDTDPNRYSLEPKATEHLRAPQGVALLNGHPSPSNAAFKLRGTTLTVERQQLTETALAMLGRGLQAQGYTIDPQAQKTVTLRVMPTGVTYQMFRYTGKVILQARFGDGTSASIPQENLGATWERGFDGAVLFALNDLLEHERFVAYLNK